MKKISGKVLGTLFVCFVMLLVKNEYSHILMRNAEYGMPALIEKGSVNNLYIGSSMFRQGLDIYTLNNREKDNYILAYNGNQPALEYRQLEYLIEHDVKISKLYVDMYAYAAWKAPEISDEKIFLEVDLKEKIYLWQLISKDNQASFGDFWRMFVNSNNELLLTWAVNYPILNSQFYLGGSKTKSLGTTYNNLIKSKLPDIEGNMNVVQEEYIDKIIAICNKNNIDVYFIETPKYKMLSQESSYLSAMEKYVYLLMEKKVPVVIEKNTCDYIMNGLASELEGISVYEFSTDNVDYYTDLIHLSYEGRVEFTEIINEIFTVM